MKRKTKRKSSLINKTGFTPGFDTENNFINYIPSEDITMRNTPYPLNATPLDQYGNPIGQTVTMQPGQDYRFGGASYVAETRMFKDGGKQEWISNKIGELVREGRPQKQAIAIAYSMYEQKHELGGRQLPMFQVGVGGFTDPANPDLGPNAFGQTAVAALPSSITSNSQYDINKTSQGLPANWSIGVTQQKIQPLSLPKPAGGVPTTSMPGTTPAQQITQGPAGAAVDTLAERQGQENARNERDARADFESGARRHQFVDPYSGYGIGESLAGAGIAAGEGRTGEAALFGANALLQGTKSFLSGVGAGKRKSSITGSMYENELDYMKGSPRYGEDGGEIEYDTEMEDMDDMDDLPMKQRIAMLAQSYQMPELDLPQYETQQQQEEMRKGGYYKFGGKKYPMYQEGDLYGEEKPDLMQKYPKEAIQKQAIEQRRPAIYPQPEPTVNEFGFPITNSAPQLSQPVSQPASQPTQQNPKEVWQIWQEVTGKPWSAAKKEGFTDGSAKANMALAEKLLKGEKLGSPKGKPAPQRKVQAPAQPQVNPFETPDGQYGIINKNGILLPIQNNMNSNAPIYGGQLKEVVVGGKKKAAPSGYSDPYKGFYYDKEGDLRNAKGTMVGHDGKPLNFFERNFGQMAPVPPLDENGRRMKSIPDYLNTTKESNDYMNKYRKFQQQQKNNGRSGRRFQGGGVNGVEDSDAANYENRNNTQLANYENDLENTYNNMYNSQVANYQSGLSNLPPRQPTPTLEDRLKINTRMEMLNKPAYYQEGGMQPEMEAPQEGMPEQGMPQQGGGDQMQQIMAQVASMLQQGASPQEVLQQLVQAGIPQEQAVQIVQAAMQQAQGAQQATPQLGYGGYYQEGGQEMPAQQPQDQGNQMGQVVAQIAEALQQGANPEEVLQQLIQMGVPEQEASQMIQMVMQQMQQAQGAQQAPPQEEMQQQTMKMGGKYLNMLRGKTIKSYTYNPKTDSYDIKYK